ncbi:MAG: hypothetical protein GEU79_16905 [Acidimicrobiia bacterium]|nr:hypothetical protein [Acidimicrobiia bacterium]
MSRFVIRIGIIALSVLAIFIAGVPLLALLDLLGGGTGYGLCEAGLDQCRNPYTAAPELSVLLTVGLLGCVAGIRILVKLQQRVDKNDHTVRE